MPGGAVGIGGAEGIGGVGSPGVDDAAGYACASVTARVVANETAAQESAIKATAQATRAGVRLRTTILSYRLGITPGRFAALYRRAVALKPLYARYAPKTIDSIV